jgi:hypothetical protein
MTSLCGFEKGKLRGASVIVYKIESEAEAKNGTLLLVVLLVAL